MLDRELVKGVLCLFGREPESSERSGRLQELVESLFNDPLNVPKVLFEIPQIVKEMSDFTEFKRFDKLEGAHTRRSGRPHADS